MSTNAQIMEVLTSINERLDKHETALTLLINERRDQRDAKEAPVPKTKTNPRPVTDEAPKNGERRTKTFARKAVEDRLANLQRDRRDPKRKNPGGVLGMLSKKNCRDLLAGTTVELTNRHNGVWVITVR